MQNTHIYAYKEFQCCFLFSCFQRRFFLRGIGDTKGNNIFWYEVKKLSV